MESEILNLSYEVSNILDILNQILENRFLLQALRPKEDLSQVGSDLTIHFGAFRDMTGCLKFFLSLGYYGATSFINGKKKLLWNSTDTKEQAKYIATMTISWD